MSSKPGSIQKQREIDHLNRLDAWRDAQIEQACKSPASTQCQGWTAAIQAAARSFQGQWGNGVDTAERSSVLNQAFKYQQAVNNPFLHGVGTGLLKLTPPGIAVGTVGGVAAMVDHIANQGLISAMSDVLGGIADIPQSLRARLNSTDPTVRGEALVDVLALSAGVTTVTAGGARIALNQADRAKINAALAKAEEQAIAKARVDNNASADMAGLGESAIREFKPGTTRRAETINAGQVTDRDGLQRIDDAKRINDQSQGLSQWSWITQRPAWKEGTTVTDRVTTQVETYRMVVDQGGYDAITKALENGNATAAVKNMGGWATKDPVNTLADARNSLAISSEWKGQGRQPMYVIEFQVKPGVGLREGSVGPMYDRNIAKELPGGGHQIQFMDNSPYQAPGFYKINLSKSKELK